MMPVIHLTTFIAAPVDRVFDLSRSISLHKIAATQTNEKIIDGVMAGLINEGESITWKAKHLFKERRFTTKVIELKRPVFFIEEMIKADLKSFQHQHHFKAANNGTIMIESITYECFYGMIGIWFSKFYLKNYIQQLLLKKNQVIKEYAETTKWKAILI